MTYDKECTVCGKIFFTKSHRAKYCCEECREIGTKKKQKEWNEEGRALYPAGTINDILNDIRVPFTNSSRLVYHNAMARALGVDYGTFMAMREGRLPMIKQ